ncbi:fatty acid desaturase [Aerophototrophica crusticola]|uniref:fatty acid desaturase n=1 Tax=Aerophototrophica crusticola TaxID=1709002 RepID=UPI00384F9054
MPLTATLARELARHCRAYREPMTRKAIGQLATTVPPFLLLVGLMLWAAAEAWWPGLLLALPAGGLLVRLFTIQHDCGHGSYFRSRAANDRLGRALSLLTATPYDSWKRAHALHHATTGDLDRRGVGDVRTLTVREYRALPWAGRLWYRLYRNPVALVLVGSPLNFLVLQRLPNGMGLPWRAAWRDVAALDAALALAVAALAPLAGGVAPVLLALVPTVCVAAWVGGWLFYVQHQHGDAVWERGGDWDFHRVAPSGSSYYVLPRALQWLTGNVGLHHVHHLDSRVPNYRLQECLEGHDALGRINRLTLLGSLRCARLALWDEGSRRLVTFAEACRGAPVRQS